MRLVRVFAKRFTVQERIGRQIADGLVAMLQYDSDPALRSDFFVACGLER